MTIRARVLALALAFVMAVLVEMCFLAIFDEFAGIPGLLQWTLSLAALALVLWRFLRVGVKVSSDGLTLLNVLRDVRVPWESVRGVTLADGTGGFGRTDVPCVQVSDDEITLGWLAGYSFRGTNRRVARQTETIRSSWLEHCSDG